MEHPIFDLTFAGSRESVLCGFPDDGPCSISSSFWRTVSRTWMGSGNGLQVL